MRSSVAVWTDRFGHYPAGHPFRGRLDGPGDWYGLEAHLLVGVPPGSHNLAVDLRNPEIPIPVETLGGVGGLPWRWAEGVTTIFAVGSGSEVWLTAIGGALDGQRWLNFDWPLQGPLQTGFVDVDGAPYLLMRDANARSTIAKPLDDTDSPPITVLGSGFDGLKITGQFDDDGIEDLAIVYARRAVAIWRGPLDRTVSDRVPDLVFNGPDPGVTFFGTFLAAADLDGDGIDELAVSASGGGPGAVFIYRDLFPPTE